MGQRQVKYHAVKYLTAAYIVLVAGLYCAGLVSWAMNGRCGRALPAAVLLTPPALLQVATLRIATEYRTHAARR